MAINCIPQTTGVGPAMTPADAQGGNFTPAVGQSLEHLGEEGSKEAADLNRIQYHQQMSDGVTQIKQNVMQADENLTAVLEKAKTEVPENGAGYVDKFKEQFDPWAKQLVEQQTNPQLRKIAESQALEMHNRFFKQAAQWQTETNRAWRVSTFDDSITQSAARVQQDPAAYEGELKSQLETISALSPELHPADKIALSQKTRRSLAEGASLGFVQAMPAKAAAVLSGEQPLPDGSLEQQINTAADKYGVDRATLHAQHLLEQPDPSQPGNGGGPFQFEPGIAKQYGGNDADAAARLTRDNQKTLQKSLGRDVTPYDIRLAHWFGAGGAVAMLKSPDTATVQSVTNLSNADLAANGLNDRSTVGDVKHLVQVNMDKALTQAQQYANAPAPGEDGTKEMPPFLQQLSPQGRQAMLTHAQGLMRKDQTVERAQVESRFNDAAAAYERGQTADAPSLAEWQHAYGPQLGLMHYQKQTQLQDFGAQYAKVATASPSEQAAIYAQSGGQHTAEGMKLHDALGQAINQANAERAADPVAFDQAKGMKIAQPIDWQNPQTLTAQLSRRFTDAEQISGQFGTPYTPLAKQEAQNLGQFLQQAKPSDVPNYLGAMRTAAGSKPQQFMAMLGQIAPNQPVIAHAGAIADQNPQAAAMMIQGNRLLHPDGEKKESTILIPQDGGASGFKAAWAQSGAPTAYGNNQMSQDSAFQAAKAYYVAAQAPGDRNDKAVDPALWDKAVKATTGGLVDAGNGAKTLPPYGMKPEEFPDNVAKVWPNAMRAAGLDPAQHPQGGYTLTALSNGVYGVTSGSTTLMGADDRPVVFDLLAGSPTQPQQPSATPTTVASRKPTKLTTDDLKRFGAR